MAVARGSHQWLQSGLLHRANQQLLRAQLHLANQWWRQVGLQTVMQLLPRLQSMLLQRCCRCCCGCPRCYHLVGADTCTSAPSCSGPPTTCDTPPFAFFRCCCCCCCCCCRTRTRAHPCQSRRRHPRVETGTHSQTCTARCFASSDTPPAATAQAQAQAQHRRRNHHQSWRHHHQFRSPLCQTPEPVPFRTPLRRQARRPAWQHPHQTPGQWQQGNRMDSRRTRHHHHHQRRARMRWHLACQTHCYRRRHCCCHHRCGRSDSCCQTCNGRSWPNCGTVASHQVLPRPATHGCGSTDTCCRIGSGQCAGSRRTSSCPWCRRPWKRNRGRGAHSSYNSNATTAVPAAGAEAAEAAEAEDTARPQPRTHIPATNSTTRAAPAVPVPSQNHNRRMINIRICVFVWERSFGSHKNLRPPHRERRCWSERSANVHTFGSASALWV